MSVPSAWRYVREGIDLLANAAPDLAAALAVATAMAYVILDGTLIPWTGPPPIGRSTPAEHKRHGMNVQVFTDPADRLLWVSAALPGAVHDLTPPALTA